MKPCKHLDYSKHKFIGCVLRRIGETAVQYWEREPPYPGAPTKVQFCGAGRGRINSIFACYNPGEMLCYEPESKDEAVHTTPTP